MSEITLGCIATDIATGFEGVVTSKNELFNGNVQYAIQPKMPKGSDKVPESFSFDAALVKFKSKGISDKATPAQKTDIRVGDEVEDIVSGHTGVVTTLTTFINGCVYGEVTTKEDKAKKIESKVFFVSCTRLKPIGKKSVKPITAAGEKPTGGPITRAFRAH